MVTLIKSLGVLAKPNLVSKQNCCFLKAIDKKPFAGKKVCAKPLHVSKFLRLLATFYLHCFHHIVLKFNKLLSVELSKCLN